VVVFVVAKLFWFIRNKVENQQRNSVSREAAKSRKERQRQSLEADPWFQDMERMDPRYCYFFSLAQSILLVYLFFAPARNWFSMEAKLPSMSG
jgi:hypothetical protein